MSRVSCSLAPGESPGFVLWKVSNPCQRAQRAALTPFEPAHGQFVLLANLWWLQELTEVVTRSDRAHHAELDGLLAWDLVRKLEERRLMRRTEHPREVHQARARGHAPRR
ncbi:MAG: hypothetical protein INH41_29710 [Myxococcaceae bacterium]|nr:hypothetical protein [Myxococcaceae bacterium]MCA3016580.1 hypothetical protein [Myxococcaceae bacterium]